MFKNYLLFHKAIKDAADSFDFEEVRLGRPMVIFILCIHYIIDERERNEHPLPHVKSREVHRLMRYLKMEYGTAVVYNNISKLVRMGVIESVAKPSRIGKAQMFVFTNIGDYLIQYINNRFEQSLVEEYDIDDDSLL